MLCLDNIRCVFSNCFMKEKYFWKFVFLICTILLVFQLFLNYFSIMPTVSSFEKIEWSSDIIPDILICRREGLRRKHLIKHGYNSVVKYNMGYGNNGKFVGWNGLLDYNPLRKQFKHSIQTNCIFIILSI